MKRIPSTFSFRSLEKFEDELFRSIIWQYTKIIVYGAYVNPQIKEKYKREITDRAERKYRYSIIAHVKLFALSVESILLLLFKTRLQGSME